jgi:hypothetical protein
MLEIIMPEEESGFLNGFRKKIEWILVYASRKRLKNLTT